MAITIACPQCGWSFQIARDLLRKRLRCLKCHTTFEAEAPRQTAGRRRPEQEERANGEQGSDAPLDEREATHQGPRRIPKANARTEPAAALLLLDPFVLLGVMVGVVWGLLALLDVLIGGTVFFVLLLVVSGAVFLAGVIWFTMALAGRTAQGFTRPLLLVGIGAVLYGTVFPLDLLVDHLHPSSPRPAQPVASGPPAPRPNTEPPRGLPTAPPARVEPAAPPPVEPAAPPPVETEAAPPPIRPLFEQRSLVYLAEIQEFGVPKGSGRFIKDGSLGPGRGPIIVNGIPSPRGLSLQPSSSGPAAVRYRPGKQAALFVGLVALDDTSRVPSGPATFEVLGDGTRLWISEPVSQPRQTQSFQINVSQVDVLELRVHTPVRPDGGHAVWIEPRLLQTADTPDP